MGGHARQDDPRAVPVRAAACRSHWRVLLHTAMYGGVLACCPSCAASCTAFSSHPPPVLHPCNRRAAEVSKVHGKLSCLMINDLDAGIGHFENTQVGGCCCGGCFLGRAASWGAVVGNALQVGAAVGSAHAGGYGCGECTLIQPVGGHVRHLQLGGGGGCCEE